MKLKLDRILSIATLLASLVALVLVLKKPAPVAAPPNPTAIAEHAQSFDQKMAEFERATEQPPADASAPAGSADSKPAVRIDSDEASAVLAQSLGNGGEVKPDSTLGAAPTIKDQQVHFEGDLVRGQFLTEIAGKDVWITISGHLGEKDGYATFEPTEFKVGDLNVPVSLVNPALQKKLSEQRDRLKLPDNVGSLKVENGELVLQGK
ncbi:MAG TPA: hypothetical protein VMX38_23350 [Verrucomicrobiae bacterium]|jgi:hypothetical protein|nr:hypothetical protein [Verrucomicrobiae bacterium]